jgi:type II secretory pathway predicted ATPase ExeA
MYKSFFGLKANPFGMNPDPRFLFLTRDTREVLASLAYGVQSRRGFVVLTGEVGTGKTTLLNKLLEYLRMNRVATAFVFNPRMEATDFLQFVAADFGVQTQSANKSHLLLRLNHWLLERYRAGETAALIIDEAQNLSPDLLEEIRLLTNLETFTEKLLQIVLSGQPELDDKLRSPDLRQLRQRIALRCRTRPLSLEDSHAYIQERLRLAGCVGKSVFVPEAVDAVFRYAQGIARVTNLVCEHALISAYAAHSRQVTADIVHDVARDLELDCAAFGSDETNLAMDPRALRRDRPNVGAFAPPQIRKGVDAVLARSNSEKDETR